MWNLPIVQPGCALCGCLLEQLNPTAGQLFRVCGHIQWYAFAGINFEGVRLTDLRLAVINCMLGHDHSANGLIVLQRSKKVSKYISSMTKQKLFTRTHIFGFVVVQTIVRSQWEPATHPFFGIRCAFRLAALSPQIAAIDRLTGRLLLLVHKHTDRTRHLQFEYLTAIVCDLHHFGMMFIQHFNAIHRYNDVAYFETGALSRCFGFNSGDHDRFGAMYAKTKFTGLTFNHNGFVNA